ncbi:MAG: homocysteine S-methyltransferase family protein [Phycisphaerae bacterium]
MPIDLLKLAPRVAVCDGGWSTQLQALGLPADVPAEVANVTHTYLVEKLARDYLAAGAQVITTNTFACNPYLFALRGAKHDPRDVARAGVESLRKTIGSMVPLVGVIGPSGKIMAIQEVPESELATEYQASARVLSEAGVDAIVLETFSELSELLLAVGAVKSVANLPVIACLSFDSGPQRSRTRMGVTAEDAAKALDASDADIIGSNCGGGAATALAALVALRSGTSKPIWIKPSAGIPDLDQGRAVYPQSTDEFGAAIPPLLEGGASYIGGCCGVGPEHIRRVAHLVESHRRHRRAVVAEQRS